MIEDSWEEILDIGFVIASTSQRNVPPIFGELVLSP